MNDSIRQLQLIKDVIDSICYPCARRMIHFQYFVLTSNSQNSNYWITEYLKEKRIKETGAPPMGCGVCFGLLEKYSQTEYLTDVKECLF